MLVSKPYNAVVLIQYCASKTWSQGIGFKSESEIKSEQSIVSAEEH
jgi:hypothetical protein